MLRGHVRERASIVVGGEKHAAKGASFIGWLGHIRMAGEQSVELAIIVINLRVNVSRGGC